MQLKDLAIKHDYYASDSNYYSSKAGGYFNTWSDFYEEFKDANIDSNLVYRWDIYKGCIEGVLCMNIVIIAQQKGIYMPIHISCVEEKDVEQIISFMKPHFEKLLSIWQPLSGFYLGDGSK